MSLVAAREGPRVKRGIGSPPLRRPRGSGVLGRRPAVAVGRTPAESLPQLPTPAPKSGGPTSQTAGDRTLPSLTCRSRGHQGTSNRGPGDLRFHRLGQAAWLPGASSSSLALAPDRHPQPDHIYTVAPDPCLSSVFTYIVKEGGSRIPIQIERAAARPRPRSVHRSLARGGDPLQPASRFARWPRRDQKSCQGRGRGAVSQHKHGLSSLKGVDVKGYDF